MKKQSKEKILNQSLVFKGNFLNIIRDDVELPDGSYSTREYVNHIGASTIITFNSTDNKYLLLKQYRHPLQNDFYEFPAGKRDAINEDYLDTAKRELLEETGYIANDWRSVGYLHPNIGYANEIIYIFFASALSFKAPQREQGEHIEVFWFTENEINELIKSNKISDGKTLSAWMLYQLNKK